MGSGVNPEMLTIEPTREALDPTIRIELPHRRMAGARMAEVVKPRPATSNSVLTLLFEDNERYEIVEEIGRGGMAVVFRGRHKVLGLPVAIKVLSTQFADHPTTIARFRLEAQSVARLRHPNILAVYDYGEEGDYAYLVSELVENGSLRDKLGAPLPLPYVLTIATQVASALDFIHGEGVLHRDIKPGNILLTKDGRPVLADFGLAKILERPSELTDMGTILGSPESISPEQVLGEEIDERSDVYCFGVVLYQMLAGSAPFVNEKPVRTIWAHAYAEVPSPRTYNPELSEEIEQVLLKALAKNPDERYQTAGELVQALKDASVLAMTKQHRAAVAQAASARPEPVTVEEPRSPEAASAPAPVAAARPSWLRPFAACGEALRRLFGGREQGKPSRA
jgi:serine/threonine protein kinase